MIDEFTLELNADQPHNEEISSDAVVKKGSKRPGLKKSTLDTSDLTHVASNDIDTEKIASTESLDEFMSEFQAEFQDDTQTESIENQLERLTHALSKAPQSSDYQDLKSSQQAELEATQAQQIKEDQDLQKAQASGTDENDYEKDYEDDSVNEYALDEDAQQALELLKGDRDTTLQLAAELDQAEETIEQVVQESTQEGADADSEASESFSIRSNPTKTLELSPSGEIIANESKTAENAQTDADELSLSQTESPDGSHDPSINEAGEPENTPKAPLYLDVQELQSCIEAILFMSDRPVSLDRLKTLLGGTQDLDPDESLFREAIQILSERYQKRHHGIEVLEVNGGFQFRTKLARADLAKTLVKVQTQRLSAGAMETLAIVAYRQPAMKEDIDQVRGVDSSYFIRTLLDRKLVKIAGRSELPGKPILYETTSEFLELFGLKDLSSMPSLRELEQMVPQSEIRPQDEDPRVREMRKLVHEMANGKQALHYNPEEDDKILKEIRDRVTAIPTSTRTLDELKDKAKAEAQELKIQAQQLSLDASEQESPKSPQSSETQNINLDSETSQEEPVQVHETQPEHSV